MAVFSKAGGAVALSGCLVCLAGGAVADAGVVVKAGGAVAGIGVAGAAVVLGWAGGAVASVEWTVGPGSFGRISPWPVWLVRCWPVAR